MNGMPYIPNTSLDREQMLHVIGVKSVDELFEDIPAELGNTKFNLPPPLSEFELNDKLCRSSKINACLEEYACFLGAGYYKHFVPGVIGHITGRSEFYTPYTPYQAEVSQGTLHSIYDYQSLICQLTGMEISNAGMYDGSSAAAEAALMACRVTERSNVEILSTVNPHYQKVISTYLEGRDIKFKVTEADYLKSSEHYACLVVQSPDFFGRVEDLNCYAREAHSNGALLIVIANPISLGIFKPPADYEADIVVGEAQSLGNPLSFGGPGLGFFTCKKEYLRQMPGRIVGKTRDIKGKPGYVLTLSTREQHIRREEATSNICTSEALVALATTVYLATLGKNGLRQVAELCYHKAHYAANQIAQLTGYSLPFNGPFFNEFVICCPHPPAEINRQLFDHKIIGGLDVSNSVDNGILLCVTETNTKAEIDNLVKILGKV